MATQEPARAGAIAFRASMKLALAELREPPHIPAGYWVGSYDLRHLASLSELEFAAYLGGPDAAAYPEFLGSPALCRRAIEKVVWRSIDNERSLMLWHGDELAGHLHAWAAAVSPGLAVIQDLAVHPDHRGLGAGRALLLECLNRYRRAGFKTVGLSVTTTNARAVALYESLGFQEYEWWLVSAGPRAHG